MEGRTGRTQRIRQEMQQSLVRPEEPREGSSEAGYCPRGSGCPALQLRLLTWCRPHHVPGGRRALGNRPASARASRPLWCVLLVQDPAPGTASAMPSGMGTSSACLPARREQGEKRVSPEAPWLEPRPQS